MKKVLSFFAMIATALSLSNAKAEDNSIRDKKVLVAYFSATGNTKLVAEKLAKAVDGDLFEIKPLIPYSADDLDWRNSSSRSSVEMKDKNSRPEIASQVEDMSKYEVIYVGFPIWWYREPSIIDTFMESYDFSKKTVIAFATSGGSGLGDTDKNIAMLVPSAKVLEGKLFRTSVSVEELKDWASKNK